MTTKKYFCIRQKKDIVVEAYSKPNNIKATTRAFSVQSKQIWSWKSMLDDAMIVDLSVVAEIPLQEEVFIWCPKYKAGWDKDSGFSYLRQQSNCYIQISSWKTSSILMRQTSTLTCLDRQLWQTGAKGPLGIEPQGIRIAALCCKVWQWVVRSGHHSLYLQEQGMVVLPDNWVDNNPFSSWY